MVSRLQEELKPMTEEDRRRLEAEKKEQKRLKEEKKRKALESAQRMQKIDKFCVVMKRTKPSLVQPPSKHWLFTPFELKKNMAIAPVHRRLPLTPEEKGNMMMKGKSDYLQQLQKRPKTFVRKLKAKFFQHTYYCYHNGTYEHFESSRPAYYGTWQKRSKVVTGRRPFAKESTVNYDEDSECDDEDEDGECEDLMSEVESDNDIPNEDDINFIDDYGYLSPVDIDADGSGGIDEDRRKRVKKRLEEYAEECKQRKLKIQAKKLISISYGPIYTLPDEEGIQPEIKARMLCGIHLKYEETSEAVGTKKRTPVADVIKKEIPEADHTPERYLENSSIKVESSDFNSVKKQKRKRKGTPEIDITTKKSPRADCTNVVETPIFVSTKIEITEDARTRGRFLKNNNIKSEPSDHTPRKSFESNSIKKESSSYGSIKKENLKRKGVPEIDYTPKRSPGKEYTQAGTSDGSSMKEAIFALMKKTSSEKIIEIITID